MGWETVGPDNKKQKSQKAKAKTPIYKKWWLWTIVIVVLLLFFYSIGSADSGESHIYDDAEISETVNIYGDVLQQYSLIEVESSAFTDDVMIDWLDNYVKETDYTAYCVLYTDTESNGSWTGTWASGFNEGQTWFSGGSGDGYIWLYKDVEITADEWDNGQDTYEYYEYEETGETVEYIFEDEVLTVWWRVYDEPDTIVEYTEITEGMSSALEAAEERLENGCSYSALINDLRNLEGFTEEEATYAADSCGADWYEQAVICSEDCLPCSRSTLVDYLESYGVDFTEVEAAYAAENFDWYEQAALIAESYLDDWGDDLYTYYSRSDMIEELEEEGFTSEEAEYAVEQIGY